jgi:hypothetical protein
LSQAGRYVEEMRNGKNTRDRLCCKC